MDGVNDAASFVTLVQLAATIINYIKNVNDAPVQKRKLLAALVQARGVLSTMVDLTNAIDNEDWSYTIQSLSVRNGPLHTFQDLLERIARKLQVTNPSSNIDVAFNRLRWPFDQTSLQEIIASLERLKPHFLLAMANDHIRLSLEIQNELREVHSQLAAAIDVQRRAIVALSREQELIVQSLSLGNLSGEWDREKDREKVMQVKAGAEWFLRHNDFEKWRKADPTPSTLVLTGPPGSGKSSISQATRYFLKAWHQSEVDICVAYFAFNFSRKGSLTVSRVLSNIVQQIVFQRPYLFKHLSTLGATGDPLSSGESVDLIFRARRDLKQFYLILDGLDECEMLSRAVVKELLAIEPPLSVLITARPTAMFSETFQNCVTLHLNSELTFSGHLETVKKMLENDPRVAEYLDYDQENIANAAKLIGEQCDGLYVLLRTSSSDFT